MSRSSTTFSRIAIALLAWVGAGASSAEQRAGPQSVVELPPFLVEQTASGPQWRYTRSSEFEILSRCSDATTLELARSFHGLNQLLQLILPVSFQVKQDVPKTLIVYDSELLPATLQEMLAGQPGADQLPAAGIGGQSYRVLRSPRLCDVDEMTVFTSVPYTAFDFAETQRGMIDTGVDKSRVVSEPHWTLLTPSLVGYLLGERTPALPSWFVTGFMGLYGKMHFSPDAIEVGAVSWLSETETRRLRNNPKELPFLPGMPEFFAGPGGNAERARLWVPQAELFVRWALDDPDGRRPAAFWKFLDRSCTGEPASETVFTECFGFDFSRMRELLKNYLPRAVLKPVRWHIREPARLPALEFRDATGGEIARIKGDWERLATVYVKSSLPELEGRYRDQARRTLRRAYDKGDRDPRLLAALGLGECDAGNETGARGFLEEAVRGGVVRPRAYLELARLRFAEVRAHPAHDDGKLSAAQAREVLAPLAAARTQAPPLAEVYELIAEAWADSAAAPARSDLAALDEGMAFFPQRSELRYRTAELYAAQGWTVEAARLAETGERTAANDAMRARFAELRTRLGRR